LCMVYILARVRGKGKEPGEPKGKCARLTIYSF